MAPLGDIKQWAMIKNERLCKPPLDKTEFEKQFDSQPLQFIMKKSREGGAKKNTEPRAGSAPAEDSGTLREDTDAGKLITKALENCKRLFTDQYKMPFAQVPAWRSL